MPGYKALAYHTADLLFVFPGFHGGPDGTAHPLRKDQDHLSDQMVSLWSNFARTVNPYGSVDSPWPRYDGKGGKPLYLSQNIPALSAHAVAHFSAAHKCGFWQKILVD